MRQRLHSERDFYRTPKECVELAKELMDDSLRWWEPCAGDGAISSVLPQVTFASDIQPLKDGVGFIFGDKKEADVLANYLKKAGVLGKSIPLAAGDGNRTLVSLKLK